MNKNAILRKTLGWMWLALTFLCFTFVIINAIENIDFTSILALGIGTMAMWRINIIERKNENPKVVSEKQNE